MANTLFLGIFLFMAFMALTAYLVRASKQQPYVGYGAGAIFTSIAAFVLAFISLMSVSGFKPMVSLSDEKAEIVRLCTMSPTCDPLAMYDKVMEK